jgi:hypothetical protein
MKLKVKFPLFPAMKLQKGSRNWLYSYFNLGSRWGGWSNPRPSRFILGKEGLQPWYRKLSGLKGRSKEVPKISTPTGVDSRTVQPVAIRYTDALRANLFIWLLTILKKQKSNFCVHFFNSIAQYLVEVGNV